MTPSKSRNLFSRTLSASKLCRSVDTQIDATAFQSLDKKPSKNRGDKIVTMQQQHLGEMEEELMREKQKLDVAELENRRILDQLKEANRGLSARKKEVERLQESLKAKDEKIDFLESEIRKEKEKKSSLDRLSDELRGYKEREKQVSCSLQESKRRIHELEDEMDRRKVLELRMAENLVNRAKELDMTIFNLEESKIEMVGLQEKIELLEQESFGNQMEKNTVFSEEDVEALKNECRLAAEAEEKSTKAMEDLALALKEVATESNQTKEKLKNTQTELEKVRSKAEKLKKKLRETQQESELHKNTAKRVRQEAEETLLASNEKEMGFVSCIKLAEEEKASAQKESLRLSESLKAAENLTKAAREETHKLRDILKQAVNEANAAKSAASIARDENSHLQDSLSEKDERLLFFTKENERLILSETACSENMKQLKILLSKCSKVDIKNEEYDEEFEEKNDNKMNKSFSFNFEDLRFMQEPEDSDLDSDKESHRSAKTLFQRVGDLLLIRKIHHRTEATADEHADAATHPDSN